MRKGLSLLLLSVVFISLMALSAAGQPAEQTELPGTNTPRPAAFATNTPAVEASTNTAPATATASLTATPSHTATITLTPTPSNTPTPSVTPTTIGPSQYPDGINSLTGLPYPSTEAQERRNLLVKISNYPPLVRPQSGMNQADVVYEYEVEGGVTRFAAIFRSSAPRHVGPVRSGRLMDMQLVPMYQALFAYAGASRPVQQLIMSQPWALQAITPLIGDNCLEAGFCRFPGAGLAFEHTLYVDTTLVWQRATQRGININYRARGFAFNETQDLGGVPASDIFVDYYGQTDARWQYDAETAHYLRYTDGLPHYDALDGQQVWADNLIVIEVPHEERTDLFEEESRSASQQIDLWGEGRAYLFRDGVYYQGYWRRDCNARFTEGTPTLTATPEGFTVTLPCASIEGTALSLMYGDRTPMMMKPGRTWVMVTRWMNYVSINDTPADMQATGAALAASFTPTYTLTPGPSQTPEATLAVTMAIPR
jgi:hypothetical protein